MARIRSVHPSLWTDEAFVSMSMGARLLVIGIWNECDDGGAFEWKPLQLKMRIFPADNLDINALLAELIDANVVAQYEADGKKLGAVRNFGKFQRPKKPHRHHVMPPEWRTYAATQDGSPELSEDEPPCGGEPVGNRWGTGGEIAPQMEDGGGNKEEVASSLRSEVIPTSAREDCEKAKRRTRISSDWLPDAKGLSFAAERNVDPATEVPRFRDHHTAKGSLMADWAAAWRTWCQNAAAWRTKPPPAAPPEPQLALVPDDWGVNAWISQQQGVKLDKNRFGEMSPCLNGWCLDLIISGVCRAARIPATDRPRLDIVAQWCRDNVRVGEVVLRAVREQADRMDGPVRSLTAFDATVRAAAASADREARLAWA